MKILRSMSMRVEFPGTPDPIISTHTCTVLYILAGLVSNHDFSEVTCRVMEARRFLQLRECEGAADVGTNLPFSKRSNHFFSWFDSRLCLSYIYEYTHH